MENATLENRDTHKVPRNSVRLEHVNVTVSNPDKTAETLCELFGWQVRWKGDAKHGGTSIHVGADDSYLAIYSMDKIKKGRDDTYSTVGGLNHIAVVVEDLDLIEKKVEAAGFQAHSHADYEPGRRFYFHDSDGLEFEVVSYPA